MSTRKGGSGGGGRLSERKSRPPVWPPPIQMWPACCNLKATVPPLHIVEGKCGMAGVHYVCVNQMRGKRARRWECVHVCEAPTLTDQDGAYTVINPSFKKTVLAKWQRPNPAAPPTNTLLTAHVTPTRQPTSSIQPSLLHLRSPTHCPKSPEPPFSLTHPSLPSITPN